MTTTNPDQEEDDILADILAKSIEELRVHQRVKAGYDLSMTDIPTLTKEAQQAKQDSWAASQAQAALSASLLALNDAEPKNVEEVFSAYEKANEANLLAYKKYQDACHRLDLAMEDRKCECLSTAHLSRSLGFRYILCQHDDGSLEVRPKAIISESLETGERFTFDPHQRIFFSGDAYPGRCYLTDVPDQFWEKALKATTSSPPPVRPKP